MPHTFIGKGAVLAPGADSKTASLVRATISVEPGLSLTLVGHIGWTFKLKDEPKIKLTVQRDRLIFSHNKLPGDFLYEEQGAHSYASYLENFIEPLREQDLPMPSPEEKTVGIFATVVVVGICTLLGFLLIRFLQWLGSFFF